MRIAPLKFVYDISSWTFIIQVILVSPILLIVGMVYPEVGALRQVRGDPVPARHELVVMVKLENKNKLQRFTDQATDSLSRA